MGSFDILLMLGSGGPLIPSAKSLEMKKYVVYVKYRWHESIW
jgi:hypothetical protein